MAWQEPTVEHHTLTAYAEELVQVSQVLHTSRGETTTHFVPLLHRDGHGWGGALLCEEER